MRAKRPSLTPRSSRSTWGRRGRTTRTFLMTRSRGAASGISLTSAGVVEDDAERVASALQHPADAVAHGRPVPAAGALYRALARGEDEDLTLLGGDGFPARLRARALLHQQ